MCRNLVGVNQCAPSDRKGYARKVAGLLAARSSSQNLAACAHSVVKLKDLAYFFGRSGTSYDIDYQISALRQLRRNFSELRDLCENDRDCHSPITAVKPVDAPVAAET